MRPFWKAPCSFHCPSSVTPPRGLCWSQLSGYDCHQLPGIASYSAPSSSQVTLVACGSQPGARDQKLTPGTRVQQVLTKWCTAHQGGDAPSHCSKSRRCTALQGLSH